MVKNISIVELPNQVYTPSITHSVLYRDMHTCHLCMHDADIREEVVARQDAEEGHPGVWVRAGPHTFTQAEVKLPGRPVLAVHTAHLPTHPRGHRVVHIAARHLKAWCATTWVHEGQGTNWV